MWVGSSVVSYISVVKQRVKPGRSPPVEVNPRVDSVIPRPIQGDAIGPHQAKLPGLWCQMALGLKLALPLPSL